MTLPAKCAVCAGAAGRSAHNAYRLWNLHAEHAEALLLDRRVQARRDRQPEHAPRIGRIDDAVVPEPRRRVVWMALALVLLADRRLECVFFFAAPRLAGRLETIAAH